MGRFSVISPTAVPAAETVLAPRTFYPGALRRNAGPSDSKFSNSLVETNVLSPAHRKIYLKFKIDELNLESFRVPCDLRKHAICTPVH